MPSGPSGPDRQSSPLRDGRPHPRLGVAPLTRLNRYGLCARLTHQGQVGKGHVKLSKSHYQKWPSDRSESRFFSQYLCIALAICRSNPATARDRAHIKQHNKKAHFKYLERSANSGLQRARKA